MVPSKTRVTTLGRNKLIEIWQKVIFMFQIKTKSIVITIEAIDY